MRWLGSDKPMEDPEQTCNFLRGAISSSRSNTFRHEKVVRRYEGVRASAKRMTKRTCSIKPPTPLPPPKDHCSSNSCTICARMTKRFNSCLRSSGTSPLPPRSD